MYASKLCDIWRKWFPSFVFRSSVNGREISAASLVDLGGAFRIEAFARRFELAYQARTACDCIRFAIKNTEQCAAHSPQLREASLQLLDALDRLKSAERHFQERFHLQSEMSTDPRALGSRNVTRSAAQHKNGSQADRVTERFGS